MENNAGKTWGKPWGKYGHFLQKIPGGEMNENIGTDGKMTGTFYEHPGEWHRIPDWGFKSC